MKVQFIKRANCVEAGKVVAETEGDLPAVAQYLLDICDNRMGDDCFAKICKTPDEARELLGEIPEKLAEVFEVAKEGAGVLISGNGSEPEFLPLPAEGTEGYHMAIFNDLTSCDWCDCRVEVQHD